MGERRVYRFGLFEVDAQSGELRKQGMRLKVRGRPIDILLLLLERPGDVVTRDDLRSRLWSADTFVDFDHGLNSAVNRLRDALGDSAENPRFIETLPRRGYRFLAPVTQVAAPSSPQGDTPPVAVAAPAGVATVPTPLGHERAGALAFPPVNEPESAAPRRRWTALPLLGAAAIVIALAGAGTALWRARPSTVSGADRMTMIVLPFQNLSGEADQDYFSDGFTEEMIAALGMLHPDRLGVIGRTTSMLYKNAGKSIGDIGKELGVTYVLEGSVRRSASRVRITAQLVESRRMTNLWSQTYERDVTDVLTIQSDVAREIAAALTLALTPAGNAPRSATTPSLAAHELFMRGRAFREQATEQGARTAIEYYEKAIAADPGYAAAHAAIADAYRLLGAPGWEVEPPSVLLPRAKAAAERALALDARSPEARAVLAMIKMNFEWDLAGAEREIQEALRLNPSFAQAHQYYSGILTPMGRADEAIAAARRAVELDPMAATATTSLGVRYYYAKRPSEAIAQFTKTLEGTPGFAVAHWGLAQCYRLQGRFTDQIEQLRSAVQLSGSSAYMRAHLAYGYGVAGDRARAEAIRREIAADRATKYVAPYHLALIAAGLGEHAEAMKWLEQAFADRSGWLVFLGVEPEFDGMRKLPEFSTLLARVKQR